MIKKIVEYILTFFCIITLNFFLPRLMPGDPFTFLSSDTGEVTVSYTEAQIEKYKSYYGLDLPLSEQYCRYVGNIFKGYLGYSIYYNEDVLVIIEKKAYWTVTLVVFSLIISSTLGTFLGSLSAWYRDKLFDRTVFMFMVMFSEIPAFLIGLLLLFIGSAWLGWFPLSGGTRPFAVFPSVIYKSADLMHHAAMPLLALVLTRFGNFYLLSRNSMLTVLSKDYMRTAKAKGLGKHRIIFGHALRNAVIPVITRAFLSLGTVFGGAVLVENVFNYPGLGKLMREAVMVRDYVLIQGIFIFVATAVLSMNLIADILTRKLDPRTN